MNIKTKNNIIVSRICLVITMLIVILLGQYVGVVRAANNDKYTEKEEYIRILGIFDDLDEEIQSEDIITRGEFATIAARLCRFPITSGSQYYLDVPTDHPYYDSIQLITASRLMNGVGDNLFSPDEPLTQEQAISVLVKVLGYETIAVLRGGYPDGYMQTANSIGISNGSYYGKTQLTYAMLTELVADTLEAKVLLDVPSPNSTEYTTEDKRTLQYELFSIIKMKGKVTATETTSINGADAWGKGFMKLGNTVHKTSFDARDFLGYNVICYCAEDDDNRVVFISMDKNNEAIIIDSVDLENYSENVYTYKDNTRKKTVTLSLAKNVIYNGRYAAPNSLTDADYIPEVGYVELIDADDDDLYELVKITSYQYYTLRSVGAQQKMLYDKYGKVALNMDDTDNDRFVHYSAYGKAVELSYFKPNDVLEVIVSKDGKCVEAELVYDCIEGVISGLDEEELIINGNTYKYIKSLSQPITDQMGAVLLNPIEMNLNGRFFVNSRGEIVAYQKNTTNENEIGYLIDYRVLEDDVVVQLRLKILVDTEPQYYYTADRVQLVCTDGSRRLYKQESQKLSDKLTAELTDTGILGRKRGVIRFALDNEGKISKIEVPKDMSQVSSYAGYSTDVFAKDAEYTNIRIFRQKIGSKYSPGTDTKVIVVPSNPLDAKAEDIYHVSDRSYWSEDVKNTNVEVYGADENSIPAVCVVYSSSSGGIGSPGEVMRNPIFLLTKVKTGILPDGDMGVILEGWQSGSLITRYAVEGTESYKNGDGGGRYNFTGYHNLIENLKRGDIIQYNTDAKGYIAKFNILHRASSITLSEYNAVANEDLSSFDAINILHTMFARVVRIGSESITVNARTDQDLAWNRTYLTQNSPQVLLYDSINNEISKITLGDIQVGDTVFMRDYYHSVYEIVVYR